MTDYERIGGDQGLRPLVRLFVDRMATDFVIGFRFEGRDLDRIAHHETEHAAALLGGPTGYTGRSLALVHEPLRISRGQFQRRLALLATVLREKRVPEDIVGRWIDHDRGLEPEIADNRDCVG